MPETSVIVGASLAVHFFSPRPATGGRAEEGLGHRGGAKRRSEPPTVGVVGNSDPMIEAGAPSTEEATLAHRVGARPTGDSHGRTTRGPAQRTIGKSEGRAALGCERRARPL